MSKNTDKGPKLPPPPAIPLSGGQPQRDAGEDLTSRLLELEARLASAMRELDRERRFREATRQRLLEEIDANTVLRAQCTEAVDHIRALEKASASSLAGGA